MSERPHNYSAKVAGIREWSAAQQPTPARQPMRVYNNPARAAKGCGVPPKRQEEAPKFVTPLLVERGTLLITPSTPDENGHPRYAIVGPDGDVYAESGRMADFVDWLRSYASTVDRSQSTA